LQKILSVLLHYKKVKYAVQPDSHDKTDDERVEFHGFVLEES
jgi:hypothetical protein